MLIADPTASRNGGKRKVRNSFKPHQNLKKCHSISCISAHEEMFFRYVRATLDLQGADVLHTTLHDVLAAGGELHTPSLEVLLIVHSDLGKTRERQ